MTILLCFDVYGTLDCKENGGEEYLKGIIPTSLLESLESKFDIAIVSPSPYFHKQYKNGKHWFGRNGSNDYRLENLNDAASRYHVDYFAMIYVDDLEGNRKMIEKQTHGDLICYSPEQFMSIFSTTLSRNEK